MGVFQDLSAELANRTAQAAAVVVSVQSGQRPRSGILWRPDVVVVSEQVLPEPVSTLSVVHGGIRVGATLAGRDPGTNVAVLKLETPVGGASLQIESEPARVGSVVLVVGADGSGRATARLAMVHEVGGTWHSMAGGRIDALIRLDVRLSADEGGPVFSSTGGLVGMSTAGPRRRTIVIPAATLERVVDPLLTDGRIARGWLGVGLQPVMIPDGFRQTTGRETALMVVSLADGSPAVSAGILPGDILLDIDGVAVSRARSLAAALGPDRVGQPVAVRLLRAGAVQTMSVTVAARPAP
jgi:S1-C subfamily serine protease